MKFNKKFILNLFLALLFLFLSVYYIKVAGIRTETSLKIKVSASGVKLFKLQTDKDIEKIKVTPSSGYHWLRFRISKKEVKSIRFLPMQAKRFFIEEVRFGNILKQKKIGQKNIIRFLRLHKNLDIIRGDPIGFQVKNKFYFIDFNKNFIANINKLGQEQSFLYLIALLLTAIFFIFLQYSDFSLFRIFLHPRVFVNMALIFTILIFLPLLNDFFHFYQRSQLDENRRIASLPEFRFDSFHTFLKNYKEYYRNTFIFRSRFIKANNSLKVRVFKTSPVAKVVLGKNNWLFLAQDNKIDSIEYYRNASPFTKQEMATWLQVLEWRRNWLRSRGIHYLLIIAPNKSTIYPEYMPDNLYKVFDFSRLDQLLNYLRSNSDLMVLDLRNAILNAKTDTPVYSKLDTHWNGFGAYIAYREIIKQISVFFPGLEPLPLSDFKVKVYDKYRGDLEKMIFFKKNFTRDTEIRVRLKIVPKIKTKNLAGFSKAFVDSSVREYQKGEINRAIMVHDSFGYSLRSFLALHFSRIVFLRDWRHNFYKYLIEQEKPDIFLEELVERFLMGAPFKNFPELEE